MIEVRIKDTETNMEKSFIMDKDTLKYDPLLRVRFSNSVNIMLGEFLRDLREQWKEENK